MDAASSSDGAIRAVDDEEISEAHRDLAHEGIFVELESAAGVAGLRRLAGSRAIPGGARIVCVLTGHGLKDPDSVMAAAPTPRTIRSDTKFLLDGMNLI